MIHDVGTVRFDETRTVDRFGSIGQTIVTTKLIQNSSPVGKYTYRCTNFGSELRSSFEENVVDPSLFEDICESETYDTTSHYYDSKIAGIFR